MIVWSAEAERTLLTIRPIDATSILNAVEVMERSGRGFVRNMLDEVGTLGLYVGEYVVLFVIDEQDVMHVRRVRKRAP